ncbi:signal peptidase I [Terrabacter sp. 2YAF2]|uniref:signal peptidase I n=1 Tax=Terrabacter sp. 2YAF2 TaxID=3233026 RepID=UPI003F9BDE10
MSAIPLETKLAALSIRLDHDSHPVTPVAEDREWTDPNGDELEPSTTVGLVRRLWQITATVIATTAAAAFLLLAIGPHVFGYRTATMLTGSMSPGINPGDVVVTIPRAVADVRVGDVITYGIPVEDHRVETHRIVKLGTDAVGRRTVVTKGDANSNVDPWVATLDGDTVWEATLVVPHVGDVIRGVRGALGQGWVLWGALAGFVLLTLRSIWTTSDTDDDESNDEPDDNA